MAKNAFNTSAHGDASLTHLADSIEKLDLPVIPGDIRAHFLHKLADSITASALDKKYLLYRPRFKTFEANTFVFTREIALLKKLQDSFAASALLGLWMETRRRQYVETLKKLRPYIWLKKEWRAASTNGKLELISDLLKLQRRVYSGGAIGFTDIPIIINESMKPRHLGVTQASIKTLTSKESLRPLKIEVHHIHLNRLLFANKWSPTAALSTAHHEQTHAFIAQLADAALNDNIAPEHLLYGDAMNAAYYRSSGADDWLLLPGLYQNDPEEKLAYQQQDAFIKEYAHDPFYNLVSHIKRYFVPG